MLYFAAVRDLVGLASEELELPPSVPTIRALGPWLEGRHEALAGRLGAVRFALDERFASDDDALHEGAVVALIPPVAGG
jgi:molybdopterin converting factor subunit 1